MSEIKKVVIIGPSLDLNRNVGGISAVTGFVISNNKRYQYIHFELGKYDGEKRAILYFLRILKGWLSWFSLMIFHKNLLVHFNIALEKRSICRDSPLIYLAQLMGKRIIIHIHGGLYMGKEDIPAWIKLILTSILSDKSPKIVLSPLEHALVTRKFQANNVFILPNSLDISDAKDFKRTYSGLTPLKLLFIGRIVKDKGIEYIFQSLKELKDKNIKFNFIMAGVGENKVEYVSRFTEILGSSFEYAGVVSGIKKTELLKKCDVFLLPSFYEGLPISLLECMSFAMVPVVTDVGSIKDIIKNGNNGIIVSKQSSEDISEAIIRLISEKNLIERLGTNARHYILENFDPDVYIEKLNEIYDMA